MAPGRDDVRSMVAALFTLTARLDRARRHRPGAAALSLLQVIAGRDGVRPSELTDRQAVHPSLVTRPVRELEAKGYTQVTADPGDGRSWPVTLTRAGRPAGTYPAYAGGPRPGPPGENRAADLTGEQAIPGDAPSGGRRDRQLLAWGVIGVLAQAAFLVGWLIAETWQGPRYSPVADTISDL